MKLKDLRSIIKEETKKVLSEAVDLAVAESMYGKLGGEHPMTSSELERKVVEPALGPSFDTIIMFKDSNYQQVASKYPYTVTEKWKGLYRSSNYQGHAAISPDGKVIKASILDNGGIVGAFYIKK